MLLISAALGIPIQFLLQFHGLALTTVSHASLMVGAMPVLLAAAAACLPASGSTGSAGCPVRLHGRRGADGAGRQPRPGGDGEPTLAGDLLVVASLFIALAWILLSKKLMQTHSPPVVTAYTILSGTVMLAVWILGPWLLNPLAHAPGVAAAAVRPRER